MAITVTPEITGQVASSTFTYCYLFEPLRVLIEESNLSATKVFIDIELVSMSNSASIVETYPQYAEFDINPGNPISVDLMRLAQQLDSADVYKFGAKEDWSFGPTTVEDTFEPELFRYRINFQIYTDITTTPIEVKKWPIRGGREYGIFYDNPAVDENSPLTEFDYYGIQVAGIQLPLPDDINLQSIGYRWGNIFYPVFNLNDPSLSDATPGRSVAERLLTWYPAPCAGGFLIWKSRFGGWMFWGFDAQTRRYDKQYDGTLEVGMLESKQRDVSSVITNNPYVQADYAKIKYGYSRTLKAYSIQPIELLALAGIEQSPAVYYVDETGINPNQRVELMRVQSVSLPIDTKNNGGDFTVTLKNISTQYQNVR